MSGLLTYIQCVKNEAQGETSRKYCEKPLTGEHVRFNAHSLEMLVQFWQLIFDQTIQFCNEIHF